MCVLWYVLSQFSCSISTSSYQINARTELAIRYNDISPLENHHCAVAFQLLDKVREVITAHQQCLSPPPLPHTQPENNIYVHLSPEQYKQLRAVSMPPPQAAPLSAGSSLILHVGCDRTHPSNRHGQTFRLHGDIQEDSSRQL